MPIAPRVDGWYRRMANTPGPLAPAGGIGGVPFLQNDDAFAALYPNATLVVQWAPEAPIPSWSDDSSGWPWLDISADVIYERGGINVSSIGRADAAAQTSPAKCSFTLKNSNGYYSKGPQNTAFYPNVKLNVPVRVMISLTGQAADLRVRFQGYIWSFKPVWDSTGNYAVCEVQAAGTSRRLQQKSAPLRSPMFRAFGQRGPSTTVAYWSMEDPSGSTQFASGLEASTTPMSFAGTWSLSNYTGITGSQALPTMTSTSTYNASITHDFNAQGQVDFHFEPDTVPSADTAIMRISMAGATGVVRWEIVLVSGSSTQIKIDGYAANATVATTSTNAYFTYVGNGPIHASFCVEQSGGNINWQMSLYKSLGGAFASNTGSFAGTVGDISQISCLANVANADLSFGQVVVYDDFDYLQPGAPAFGWTDDDAVSRASGLAYEENIPMHIDGQFGTSVWSSTGTYLLSVDYNNHTHVGEQGEEDILSLIRAAADAELGILGDGLGPGLYYRTRSSIQNPAAAMTLTIDDLQPDFEPEDDDQDTVNKMTVSRTGGSSAIFIDEDGPLGTNSIDIYDSSRSLLVRYDTQLPNFAAWLVHQGTVEGYRYPTFELEFARIPEHAASWLAVLPGSRVDVTGVSDYVPQHPPQSIELQVQGWSEVITQVGWTAQLNCTPAVSSYVGTLASSSADTSEFVTRADTDGCVLTAAINVGDTFIAVLSSKLASIWTTDAADCPIDFNIGGYKITATAIGGGTTTQGMTITASPYFIPNGSSVSLWRPTYYGV